jgi:hypothetical protein
MQAKVEIISGAGLTSINESAVDLSTVDFEKTNNIQAGAFSLVAAPGTDLNVSIINQHSLINENGETLNFGSLTIDKLSNEKGEHNISVSGTVNSTKEMKGHYNGQITAVIEYL